MEELSLQPGFQDDIQAAATARAQHMIAETLPGNAPSLDVTAIQSVARHVVLGELRQLHQTQSQDGIESSTA